MGSGQQIGAEAAEFGIATCVSYYPIPINTAVYGVLVRNRIPSKDPRFATLVIGAVEYQCLHCAVVRCGVYIRRPHTKPRRLGVEYAVQFLSLQSPQCYYDYLSRTDSGYWVGEIGSLSIAPS